MYVFKYPYNVIEHDKHTTCTRQLVVHDALYACMLISYYCLSLSKTVLYSDVGWVGF